MGLPHTQTQPRRVTPGVVVIVGLAVAAAIATAAVAGPGGQPPPPERKAQHRIEQPAETGAGAGTLGAAAWDPAEHADDTAAAGGADTQDLAQDAPAAGEAGPVPAPAPAELPEVDQLVALDQLDEPARPQAPVRGPPPPPAPAFALDGAAPVAPPSAPDVASLSPAEAAEVVARATSSLLRPPPAPSAPAAPAPVAAPAPDQPATVVVPPAQLPGTAGGGMGPQATPICPLAGQGCSPLPETFRCMPAWKAGSPGDGCPPPPMAQPVEDPDCDGQAIRLPGTYKATCLPGDPGQVDCERWPLRCDPALTWPSQPDQPGEPDQPDQPVPFGQGSGWQVQSDPGGSDWTGGSVGGGVSGAFQQVSDSGGGFGF